MFLWMCLLLRVWSACIVLDWSSGHWGVRIIQVVIDRETAKWVDNLHRIQQNQFNLTQKKHSRYITVYSTLW